MLSLKRIFITGFALFSLFFGAGNLILPPSLGAHAPNQWLWLGIGFVITAVIIPILGIFAHAKLQGTMYDFGKKVSPFFSTVYCILVYLISVALPSPRTASVTYEMAIAPFFNFTALQTSIAYFVLVFICVINRSKLIQLIGRFLTPLIIIILIAIIGISCFATSENTSSILKSTPIITGLLEGYQTFDAIGAVVVGGVLVISLNYNKTSNYQFKKILIKKAGCVAGVALLIIYSGLIFSGATFHYLFSETSTRTSILKGISTATLGTIGSVGLSVLVALACFTTAVGIITGTADYVKGYFKTNISYRLTALMACISGIVMGQFDVHYIITIALPALMFIYPITIVLIILNTLPNRYASKQVFKTVVGTTFIFSIPDFLKFFIKTDTLNTVINVIPLAEKSLGWVMPAIISFCVINIIFLRLNKTY